MRQSGGRVTRAANAWAAFSRPGSRGGMHVEGIDGARAAGRSAARRLQWDHGTPMSYKEELSPVELQVRRQPLETAAAMQLGLILFAFSRLDLHLRALLEDAGQESLPTDAFPDRLRRLGALAARLPDEPLGVPLREWIARAQVAHSRHESLVQGHWLPDLRRGLVLNVSAVTGRPVTTDYSVSDLEGVHRTLHELLDALQRLAQEERQLRVPGAP